MVRAAPCTGNAGDPVVALRRARQPLAAEPVRDAEPPLLRDLADRRTRSAPTTCTRSTSARSPTTSRSACGRTATTSPPTSRPTRPTPSTGRRCSPATRPRTSSSSPAQTNFLLPADVDGPPPPPAGGGLFYTFKDDSFHGGADRIELFRLTPNFATPASSTFTLVKTFPIAPFTYTVCGFFNFNCIPQQGTAQRVDAVSEWPMHRFAYRSFARPPEPGRQLHRRRRQRRDRRRRSAGSSCATRTGSAAGRLFQEGTHDPGDGHDRFMGSIAMDEDGNIALGYSVSSSTLFPAIRYATRERRRSARHPASRSGRCGRRRLADRLQPLGRLQRDVGRPGRPTASSGTRTSTTTRARRANWKTVVGAFTMPGCTLSDG